MENLWGKTKKHIFNLPLPFSPFHLIFLSFFPTTSVAMLWLIFWMRSGPPHAFGFALAMLGLQPATL